MSKCHYSCDTYFATAMLQPIIDRYSDEYTLVIKRADIIK